MLVPISGQVTGREEAENVAQVANSQHFGGGVWTNRFERGIADYMGARYAVMTNSGSSALLLALSALELPKGSRVLTSAVNFPTTVNAIVQCGHIPVFIDSDPKTLNPVPFHDIKADAAIFAHTLGNPIDFPKLDYPLIEDCCDAIGSKVNGRMVGRVGVMSTASFYPAHHIATGEGGAVFVDNPKLRKVLESYRDWGRDCWCEPGQDNTCGRRYNGDYDHKYTYSRIGYNLKASDFQAAAGVAQLQKIEGFHQIRRRNWKYYREKLAKYPIDIIEFPEEASPFGFAFLTDERNELAQYLNDEKTIGNRPIMGGNLTRQPAYKNVEYRVIGSLDGADEIHERGLWIGVYPGIDKAMLDYVVEAFDEFYK
jgi:CDP-6-deoxy-D-xylo-4-hexulose-3-dehydrase